MAMLLAACLASPALASAGEYTPDCERIRKGFAKTRTVRTEQTFTAAMPRQPAENARVTSGERDSIWNGLLIGAGIGAAGGYVWARHECGSNDAECSAITNPVGILVGAGIGAAIGGILDAFDR